MMPVLISPDGRPYRSSSQVETTRLKMAMGYREEGENPPTVADEQFHPADHTVADVLKHIEQNPGDADRVIAEEKAGKARATIVGD